MMEARMIMHPSDAKAIEALRQLKGFDALTRKAMEYGYEHLIRGENLGEMVHVTNDNFPKVYHPSRKWFSPWGLKCRSSTSITIR